VRFFASPKDLRRWLEERHDRESELQIGFYKKGSGKCGISYAEALDEALCFGWIDGVRRSIDAESYTIRFTPRKPRSIWSRVNITRAAELREAGRMHPSGLAAFEGRDEARTRQYSYERGALTLAPDFERRFRENAAAWAFFEVQAPSYRRLATI